MTDKSTNSEASPLGPGKSNSFGVGGEVDADAARKKRLGSSGAIGGGVAHRT
jgi:hypothetical protein